MRWAYGVTTVPQRFKDLLPRTLASLKNAGFDIPRLFVDGSADQLFSQGWTLPLTEHKLEVRAYGNWWLGMVELFVRQPNSDRFAMFQDDFVTYKNLRQYLEKTPYPTRGYLNLYTFPSNQGLTPKNASGESRRGWFEARELESSPLYHGRKGQSGRGAVALVFSRDAMVALLSSQHLVEHALDSNVGHKKVDGSIVCSMNKAGYREYVHNPSLVQHIGIITSIRGNRPHPLSTSFMGEDFDALTLL